jgi:beta-galactosidase/beta-glucuronidase
VNKWQTDRVTAPRPEYPTPQLRRERWHNLNGVWRFAFDDDDSGRASGWQSLQARELDGGGPLRRKIIVPFCAQSTLSGIGDPSFHDVAWYGRTFESPQLAESERLVLHFGAVDYRADVWLNGQLVVSHEGGHTPFSVDITDSLRATANALVVRAEDPGCDPSIPRGKQDWHQQPSSIFYNRTTGIWQTVWLEIVDHVHVRDLRLTPCVDSAALEAVIGLAGWQPGTHVSIVATIAGRVAGTTTVAATSSNVKLALSLAGTPLELWSPEHPALYDLTITVRDSAGLVRDRLTSYLGVREIDVVGDQLLLNHEQIFLRLVLDQGYWPDGLLTAPTDEALRRDIELALAMGFNGARKHQKVEDPRWLYWADRLGFLVWGEMPNAHHFSPDSVQRTTREWSEVVLRDYNHPCLIAWVPINESAGCRTLDDDRRTWVGPFQEGFAAAMYFLTKALDPTRPSVSNDGWEHTHSDLCTVHDYRDAEALTRRFSSHDTLLEPPERTPPVYVDGRGYGGEPVLVTEYGGIFIATRVEGLDYAVVEDEQQFERRLKELTTTLVTSPVVGGFCYTQLADVEHERNGLLTADRKPKIDIARIRAIFATPRRLKAGP